MAITASAFNYDRLYYTRQTLRLGASAFKQSLNGQFGASGRIFYGRQLNGMDSATVHIWEVNTVSEDGWDVDGHAMGRDSLNLGLGAYCYLNQARTLTMSADYNSIFYNRSTSQNVTAGIQWRF